MEKRFVVWMETFSNGNVWWNAFDLVKIKGRSFRAEKEALAWCKKQK